MTERISEQVNSAKVSLTGTQPAQVFDGNSSSNTIPINVKDLNLILQKYNLTLEQWQELSLETQQEYITNYNKELNGDFNYPTGFCVESNPNNPVINTEDIVNEQPKEEVIQPEVNEEMVFDLPQEQWNSMSNSERMQYLIENGTKKQYTEEQWAKMSDKQKQKAQNKFFQKTFEMHVKGWENLSSVEKLDKMSEFFNMNNIADANHMDILDLYKLQENSPEEFKKLEDEYYQTHDKIDILATAKEKKYQEMQEQKKQERNESIRSFNEYCKEQNINISSKNKSFFKLAESRSAFIQYCQHKIANGEKLNGIEESKLNHVLFNDNVIEYAKNNGLELGDNDHIKAEYEYLKSKNPEELNQFEKSKLDELEMIKEINGDNLDDIKSGDYNLIDLFGEDVDGYNGLIKNGDEIDWRNPKNRDKIEQKLIDLLRDCNNEEDVREKLQEFDIHTQRMFIKLMVDQDSKNKFADDVLQGFNYAAIVGLVDGNSRASAQAYVVGDGFNNHYLKLKTNGYDTGCMAVETNRLANALDIQYASQLQVTTATLEDELLLASANEGVAQREDALEVFAMTNETFANSKEISDKMKQFYAKNSVEVLSNSEMREAQIENLKSHNSESFNKGVAAANNSNAGSVSTSSDTKYSTNVVQPTYQDSVNSLETSNDLSKDVSNVNNESQKITQEEVHKKLEEFTKLTPQEQNAIIKEIGINRIPVKMCDECPALISHFVKAGKGLDIIRSCSTSSTNDAIALMKKDHDQRKQLAAVNPSLFSKSTQEELEKQGILKKGSNVSSEIRLLG